MYQGELALRYDGLASQLAMQGKHKQAEEHYRKAIAMQEKLAAEFPSVPEVQRDLAGIYCNFGHQLKSSGRQGESLNCYGKAIQILNALFEQDHKRLVVKQYLRNSYLGRAWAFNNLGRFDESVKDWDRVIELSSAQEQPGFRATRANSLVLSGQIAKAVAEVNELTKLKWSASSWYGFACAYALASDKISDQKQKLGDRAMEMLAKAVSAGYKDADSMAKDASLDPIRGRADFKKLFESLSKPGSSAKP
jgi:tetratricopeptide (TPR) repeat protein